MIKYKKSNREHRKQLNGHLFLRFSRRCKRIRNERAVWEIVFLGFRSRVHLFGMKRKRFTVNVVREEPKLGLIRKENRMESKKRSGALHERTRIRSTRDNFSLQKKKKNKKKKNNTDDRSTHGVS